MMKQLKRFTAILMAICMICGILPATAWAADEDPTIVIAGSDFQPSDDSTTTGANQVTTLLNQIKVDYESADGFLFAGDYEYSSTSSASESKAGLTALKNAVSGVYGSLNDEVYIQGNHDPDSLVTDGILTASGENDTDNYGVYVINEKDYMWYNNEEATIKNTAASLDIYLDAKLDDGYTKPIFVVSHLPLHYSMRTLKGGNDGMYANYIFDVLNEAGEAGLNIIFLFGHDHSHGWDDYLGGASIFLTEGDTINIAQASTTTYEVEDLHFTYMNAGYVGYYGDTGNDSDQTLTMTAFEIYSDKVVISRYDSSGKHNLKAAGVYGGEYPDNQYASPVYAADTDVVASPYTLSLATDQITKTDTTTGISVTSSGLTGLTVEKLFGTSATAKYDSLIYSSYASYDITPTGYTEGNVARVEVPLDSADGFDITRSVLVIDKTTGTAVEKSVVDGAVTFTTEHFSTYDIAQYKTVEIGENTEDSTTTIYRLVSQFSAGKNYIIASSDSAGTASAIRNSSGTTVGSTSVTIQTDDTGAYISTTDNTIIWNFINDEEFCESYDVEAIGDLRNLATGHYLNINTSTTSSYSTASNVKYSDLSNSNSSSYKETDYYYKVGENYYPVYVTRTAGNQNNRYNYTLYYLNDSKYEPIGTTHSNVRSSSTFSGVTLYTLSNGTTSRTLATTDSSSENYTSWRIASNDYGMYGLQSSSSTSTRYYVDYYSNAFNITANSSTGRVYLYEETTTTVAGTQKATVTIDSSSGSVLVGAKTTALTGTTLTITYADGTTEEADVTLSMLKDASGNAVSTETAGTYTDLKVYYTYQGKEWLILDGYTLNVNEKVVNNYPDYPNEGAVKVNKTATGIDFQASGVAQVELSTSGVPSQRGVDVVIVIDTSSSMDYDIDGDTPSTGEKSRIEILAEALEDMLLEFQKPNDSGVYPDIDIAIIDFNGYANKITGASLNNTYRDNEDKAEVYTGTTGFISTVGLSANNFVNNLSIDAAEMASQFDEDKTYSGTNYDSGLDNAYKLLSMKKEANGDEIRDQYVIFMSDGAPFRYNGYENGSSSGYNNWDKWLRGYWADQDALVTDISSTNTVNAYPYFYNGNGTNHPHRIAEAIKGNEDTLYDVVDNTATSADPKYIQQYSGLGAKIYSVGFGLAEDGNSTKGSVVVSTMQNVLKTISSGDGYYYDVDSAEELTYAFTRIATAINYAATNAYFLDQMGDAFDIQLTPSTYLPEGEDDWSNAKTITPTIKVISYDIYTRQDYLDGKCTEQQIGDRKGTSTVLETVTFTSTSVTNEDGSITYTLTGAYSDQVDSGNTNILADGTVDGYVDGVIYAKNFAYNTTLADITVNGVTVAAESFYWYVGTVTTTELAISYYVYLTGSMEGTREAGSYATNNYATLYYENYLGNDCYKDTTSPTIAWESALVRYAFYLVDSNGNPVNNNGSIVTFANKVAVTQPVIYQEILLNNLENVNSIEVASLANLPEGYTLYDEAAKYTITINSNSTGSWEIVNGKTVATTYVMQYDPSNTSAYSNELTKDSNAYDYTHTVVWFAVVWTPQCVPDTVVIDYGLPVDIHVLSNDMFGDYGKLIGVTEETVTGSTIGDATNQITDDEATGIYGTVKAITTDDNGNALDKDDSVIRYTPSSMEMNSYDTFTYSVNYAGTENAGYYYGTVTVIPATSIYYEDNYVTYSVWNQSNLNKISDDWSTEGETINATQAEDRPGQYSLSSVDANNLYGYDAAYSSCATYSMGSAKKVTVNAQQYAQATFSFYGTGFDVISLTSNTTGTITVAVKSEDGQVTRNLIVDTYYGYKYVETTDANGVKTGAWVVDENADKALYQVPVMKVTDLPYGKYNVTITAAYLQGFDHRTDGTVDEEENPVKSEYDFYLDAIRIYDPANDGAADATIANAYKADGEGWPSYVELRNQIIKAGSFDDVAGETLPESTPGLVFIDGDASVGDAQIDDYIDYGPNNEIYIAPGQRIAFMLEIPENIAGVHIGIKSADGEVGTYTITNIAKDDDEENNISAGTWYGAKTYTINTTTDMYYDLSGWKNDIIVISNTGDRYSTDGVISITNIKFTYTSNPKASSGDDNGIETAGVYMTRSAAMLTLRTINTSVETETTIPEVTVPETEGTMSGSTTDSTVSDIVGSSTSENATGTSSENVSNETTSDNSVSNDVVTDTEENIAEDEETDTVEENADTKDTMSFFGYIVAIIKDIFKAIAELFAGLV